MIPLLIQESGGQAWQLFPKRKLNFPFLWHCHKECEVLVCREGDGECMVGDWQGEYHAGDAFFLPPMLPHSFYTLASPQRKYHGLYVMFFRLESPLLQALDEVVDLNALPARWPGGVRISGTPTWHLIQLLEKVHQSERLSATAAFLNVLGWLLAMETGTPLAHGDASQYRSHDYNAQRMNVICHYLLKRCAEPVTLTEVARQAHMSIPSLCRLFQRNTGKSVFRYLRELRVNRICRQLAETDRPITELALQGGFSTLSHFNRTFQQLKGMTPREYRTQSRLT